MNRNLMSKTNVNNLVKELSIVEKQVEPQIKKVIVRAKETLTEFLTYREKELQDLQILKDSVTYYNELRLIVPGCKLNWKTR